MVKNTDFVEGIVLYAGPDTKAMLNNSGPRYKRSTLEKLANIDIIWCVVILLALCVTGAVLTSKNLDNSAKLFTTLVLGNKFVRLFKTTILLFQTFGCMAFMTRTMFHISPGRIMPLTERATASIV